MLKILIGLPAMFLMLCLVWDLLYIFEEDYSLMPPKAIKITGDIELVIVSIVVVLSIAYGIGYLILGG